MASSKFKAASPVRHISAGCLLVFIGVLLWGCKTGHNYERLPFYNTADFTAEWMNPGDKGYASIHKIGSFSLQDQSGHLFTNDSLKGKIYTANFFFTICPSICPKMMFNLKTLQDSFLTNDDVKMVSFSVMPKTDSVAKLAVYGEGMHIAPIKWHLLTGDEQAINTLGRQSFFAEKKEGLQKDPTEFLHTQVMLLIDKQARIRGVYDATLATDIARAATDIRILLQE